MLRLSRGAIASSASTITFIVASPAQMKVSSGVSPHASKATSAVAISST
jgi:hypothetical protein